MIEFQAREIEIANDPFLITSNKQQDYAVEDQTIQIERSKILGDRPIPIGTAG